MMSTAEIKTEIQKVLLDLPEDALQNVLNYLKSIVPVRNNEVIVSDNFQKILEEDKELLKKLAQ